MISLGSDDVDGRTGTKLVPGPISLKSEDAADKRSKIFGATTTNGLRKFLNIWKKRREALEIFTNVDYMLDGGKKLIFRISITYL